MSQGIGVNVSTIKQGTKASHGRRDKYVGVSMEGYNEIVKAFNDLGNEELIFKLSDPSVECAELIADKAKAKVRRISGDLADSIVVKRPGRDSGKHYQIFARVVAVQGKRNESTKGGYYAAAVELGHRLITPNARVEVNGQWVTTHAGEAGIVKEHPFMRPAADESKEQVLSIMAEAMQKIIDEEWSR